MNQYFHLFSCCIPVKGYKKAVVCDLQRNIIQPISLPLYEILVDDNEYNTASIEDITLKYGVKEKQLIEEYITFLYHNQFGYTTDKPLAAIRLNLNDYVESRSITNAIVDFDPNSTHSLCQIMPQLNELSCIALELRYYFSVSSKILTGELGYTQGSTLNILEVVVEYSDEYQLEKVMKIKESFPVLKKITISHSQENVVYKSDDLSVIYTTETIADERCCGVTNELYCIAETRLFLESVHFNSCLNKKIAVDKTGQIKNCPSMKRSFGFIGTTKLKDVLKDENFRKIWRINKDQIEVCSDCELRYVCQDCRAYLEDNQNIYSKPLKCNYNPYV